MTTTTISKVNYYQDGATWCYAAWDAQGCFDHSDTLPDADGDSGTRASLTRMFPQAELHRVEDIA